MERIESNQDQYLQQFIETRCQTEILCRPLLIEDYVIQTIEDVSPAKWHLAHTTWFYETFLLLPYLTNYQIYDPLFGYLFNSYYQSLGTPYPRFKRGLLSRPSVDKIYAYRAYVDEAMQHLLKSRIPEANFKHFLDTLILGINHEQQHQELLITDIKFNFSYDPTFPVYSEAKKVNQVHDIPLEFLTCESGLFEFGYAGDQFCFDNELPNHQVYVNPFSLASRLITNGEYLEFIDAGGYHNPSWWLADGWQHVQKENWQAPLYWILQDDTWYQYCLHGLSLLNLNEPIVHVSFYEADAYARFKNLRLPREYEWELLVKQLEVPTAHGNFLESKYFHVKPQAQKDNYQLLGDAWEWTSSAYSPYPGYQPLRGALGEYNGKFMCNQVVLKGGSCATPVSHIRPSYRNFFQPEKRWQFTSIRLAKDFKG